MRNILTKTLPTKIQTENGIFEPITDFRASIEFEIMVEKGVQDIFTLLQAYYPKGLPKGNEAAAAEAALWFYMCGEEIKKDEHKPTKRTKRVYSFAIDAEAIYSDFSRFYNIDLTNAYLHWWKFRALLAGLPTDSSFKERIYYRTCELKGLPKKEQKRIAEIRKEIEIKENETNKITLEQRDKQMLEYVTKRSNEMRG
jgi:hypothetical protein